MSIIEMARIELTGGHIGFILIIEVTEIDLVGHIEIMLIIEMAKIELFGGPIAFIKMTKIKINRRPYWHYANYKDDQNRINWRPY